jgi:hypothetical protein
VWIGSGFGFAFGFGGGSGLGFGIVAVVTVTGGLEFGTALAVENPSIETTARNAAVRAIRLRARRDVFLRVISGR